MKAISSHRLIVFSNMLDFVVPLKLRQNWLVSWQTKKVYEQNDIRLITRCCEWNILQRHEKCQLYAFGDDATGPDEAKFEIPYPALFPLPILHPNPIKTRNLAPTSNWNSHFPPLFSAQIPNITPKKSQIPHPAKPIGDPLLKSRQSNKEHSVL